jgi:hypothetical protein
LEKFEIAIVLVIGLLIYVFVSLAMVAGYHLWNIQSKVNTFQLNQQRYDLQPPNGRQESSTSVSSSADYSSKDRLRKLENDLDDAISDHRRYRDAIYAARITLDKLKEQVDKTKNGDAPNNHSKITALSLIESLRTEINIEPKK